MTKLTLSTLASASPMGQQVYEEELAGRAAAVLGPSWEVKRAIIKTLRSPLDGTVRLPARVLVTAAAPVRHAAGLLAYRGSDIVHRMDLRLPPASQPELLTIHDAVSWRYPDEASPPRAAPEEARRSAIVVCPSQFAADDVSRFLGLRDVVVIPNGVDEAFFSARPLAEGDLARLGLRLPFVLHAGGSTLRKNLAGLAAAWRLFHLIHPDVALALIGPPDNRKHLLFSELPGTINLGRVEAGLVPGIVAAASAVVVPSLYEGFGLPAIEAMAAGTPVVATRRSALPEVCGDAAILVEPTAAAIAEGLAAVFDGGGDATTMAKRGRERAARFTWEASATRHAELWRRLGATTPSDAGR